MNKINSEENQTVSFLVIVRKSDDKISVDDEIYVENSLKFKS